MKNAHRTAKGIVPVLIALSVMSGCGSPTANDSPDNQFVGSQTSGVVSSAQGDPRPLVVPSEENNYTYPDAVPNTDPPVTWVAYNDKEKGLAVSFPYNPTWGTSDYRILPYEAQENGPVLFGPLTRTPEGQVYRSHSFSTVGGSESAEEIVKILEDEYADADPPPELRVEKIHGFTVVIFSAGDTCKSLDFTIIGADNRGNYTLSSACGFSLGTGADTYKYYADIIGTLKVPD